MKKILIIGLSMVITLIIACNPDEPTPPKLDCDDIYPIYESIINTSIFNFEWCSTNSATAYHLVVSDKEDFSEIILDTTVLETTVKSIIFLVDSGNGDLVEYFPFRWGTRYYWKVATIKDSIQQEWSDTYIFETNDIRDDIVGIYEAKKRKFWLSHNGNPTYYDSVYSIHQIEVEKLLNSRGIRVKDITSADFDIELSRDMGLNLWAPQYQVYTGGEFKIDVDSFEIRNVPCDSPADLPCIGYRYSGRE